MTLPASLLPQMVTIPAGVFNGVVIDAFRLGRTPVTNAQYAAHVDRHSSAPFVLLKTDPKTYETSILCRTKTPKEAIGDLAKGRLKKWDSRDPFCFGVFTLFQLRKDTSPEDCDGPNQPVVSVSWFHALEYCVGNGLYLPSDDQWEYAARGPEGREYGTKSGKLTKKEAHYDAFVIGGSAWEKTSDVGLYPPNGFGLRDMTGNVWEWTARNPTKKWPYGLRGGSWINCDPYDLLAATRNDYRPHDRFEDNGFRVAAASRLRTRAP